MMLEIISNTVSQENNSSQDNNACKIIDESDVLKSVFSVFSKYFSSKKVESDNIIKKTKEDEKDEKTVSSNFMVNYFFNIFNKQNTDYYLKNYNTSEYYQIKKK